MADGSVPPRPGADASHAIVISSASSSQASSTPTSPTSPAAAEVTINPATATTPPPPPPAVALAQQAMTREVVEPMFRGQPALNTFQQDVLAECLSRNSGGMALPMGAGKTLIALMVGQLQSGGQPFLWVCAKSLVSSVVYEIRKFFGARLPYQVLHGPSRKTMVLDPRARVVITTPEVASRAYKQFNLYQHCVIEEASTGEAGRGVGGRVRHFRWSTRPWIPPQSVGPGMLFGRQWGCLIVDEAQEHTNAHSRKCWALGAICSDHRWMLSGTMYNEPDAAHILGVWLLLNRRQPRTLPGMREYMRSPTFPGLRTLLVHRATNPAFKAPEYAEHIVAHDLTVPECSVYTSFQQVLQLLSNRTRQMRREGDADQARVFATYMLTMVTHLRMALVCPLVPVTAASIDMADFRNRRELSSIFMRHLRQANVGGWLDDPDAMRSSRIEAVLERLERHRRDRTVVFGCFTSCLTVLVHYLRQHGYHVFTLSGNQSPAQRMDVLLAFEATTEGAVLVMSYQLGAEGLNLQCANVVMLLDNWWNNGRSQQAIARVMRMGQEHARVDTYLFTANTGIERAIFQKQLAKLHKINELLDGASTVEVPAMQLEEIIQIILRDDNEQRLRAIRNLC